MPKSATADLGGVKHTASPINAQSNEDHDLNSRIEALRI
jgi:hypothetical protein